MKERADANKKFRKHAPLMVKWLRILFALAIIQTVADVLTADFISQWLPAISRVGEFTLIGCGVVYAFVLLKLSPVSEGYRTAGVCFLIMHVLNIMKLLAESSNGLKIVLSLFIFNF